MTAAPFSPLVERVAKALAGDRWDTNQAFANCDRESYVNDFWSYFAAEAQAALEVCLAEEMREIIEAALTTSAGHWKPKARDLLAKMDGRSTPPAGLGFCPICGAPGRSREKRPNGDDLCEAGHSYPSSSALPAKPVDAE
jgi:hypothetical protein